MPLYPIFLAALMFGQQAFLPVLIAQSLVGAGSVLCAALIARELFGGTAAAVTAVLAAAYPYYVVHDTALQETSLFTFLATLGVLLAAASALERIGNCGGGARVWCWVQRC